MTPEDRLFGDVVDPSVRLGDRRWYAVPLSVLVHALAIAALVITPLLATDVLPVPRIVTAFVTPEAMPSPPPPPPPPGSDTGQSQIIDTIVTPDPVPVDAPDDIHPEAPIDTRFASPFASGGPGGHPEGVPGGQDGGVPGSDFLTPPPPRPSPPQDETPPEPVRPGGDVVAPARTLDVPPRYPPLAQAAGITGLVIIEATIGTDGRVQNARVLRSVPLLDDAALEAVRQWEYTPTLLNGRPVPILMTVTVVFSLGR